MDKKIKICLLIVVGVLLLSTFPEVGQAAEEAASSGYLSGYQDVEPKPTTFSWWSTISYLVSLFAVFLFVVVLAYVAARFLGGRFAQTGDPDGGRMLAHLPLGPNRSVCVVEMADRLFLIGVTEHNINLLSEITDEEEIERLRKRQLFTPISGEMFSQQFGALSSLLQKIPPMFRQGSSRK